jgi:hypothetical protein
MKYEITATAIPKSMKKDQLIQDELDQDQFQELGFLQETK